MLLRPNDESVLNINGSFGVESELRDTQVHNTNTSTKCTHYPIHVYMPANNSHLVLILIYKVNCVNKLVINRIEQCQRLPILFRGFSSREYTGRIRRLRVPDCLSVYPSVWLVFVLLS
jgi:hypothetical protein